MSNILHQFVTRISALKFDLELNVALEYEDAVQKLIVLPTIHQ